MNDACGSSANTLGYQSKLGVAHQSSTQFELFAEGVCRGLTSRVSPYDAFDSFGIQSGPCYHHQGIPEKQAWLYANVASIAGFA